MLTPQEIKDKKFEKAVFGGYDMAQIDEFLDALLVDYSSLYKENAALKSKMRVLVEKIEEYRSVDEEMRKTLYLAQVSAKETVAKAGAEAEAILANARRESELQTADLRTEIAAETARLAAMKNECAAYAEKMRTVLHKNIEALNHVFGAPASEIAEELKKQQPEPEPDFSINLPEDIAQDIEQAAAQAVERAAAHAPAEEARPAAQAAVRADDTRDAEAEDSALETRFFEIDLGEKAGEKAKEPAMAGGRRGKEEESDTAKIYGESIFTPKPRFKFDNLQFGKNYDENDEE